jgi:CHAT domain-containing protein
VLYFGAHAPGTVILGLGDELGAIDEELRGARYRCLEVEACWVSEADDLARALRASTPAIVHLACPVCMASGGEDGAGVVLHGPDGSVHVLSYALVAQIFRSAGSSVRLVVLTACSTEPLASLLREHVDCVIGIDGPIGDRPALEFSRGLYTAIGDGASVAQAFDAGCTAMRSAGLPEAGRPALKMRPGVDAHHVVLAVNPRRRPPRGRRTPGPVARCPDQHPAAGGSRTARRSALQRKRGR